MKIYRSSIDRCSRYRYRMLSMALCHSRKQMATQGLWLNLYITETSGVQYLFDSQVHNCLQYAAYYYILCSIQCSWYREWASSAMSSIMGYAIHRARESSSQSKTHARMIKTQYGVNIWFYRTHLIYIYVYLPVYKISLSFRHDRLDIRSFSYRYLLSVYNLLLANQTWRKWERRNCVPEHLT